MFIILTSCEAGQKVKGKKTGKRKGDDSDEDDFNNKKKKPAPALKLEKLPKPIASNHEGAGTVIVKPKGKFKLSVFFINKNCRRKTTTKG